MKNSVLIFLLLVLGETAFAQNSPSLIGQWQAKSSEFGTFYIFDWTIKANQQCTFRATAGSRYTEVQRTWRYAAPHITLLDNGKQAFKGSIEWLSKDQFLLTIIDDGNPQNQGVQRLYIRQQEQVPAKEQGAMPTQISPSGSTCYACYGTGKADCSSCGGAGGYYDRVPYQRYNPTTGYYDTDYRDEWRHCTAMGCDGGKVKCTSCKHRDVHQSATYGPVPAPEGLIGRWKSGGSVYHFQAQVGMEGRYLTIEEGHTKMHGYWVIEDGFLKIRLFLGGDSQWKKYRFGAFDRNNIQLIEEGGYQRLQLQRLKE